MNVQFVGRPGRPAIYVQSRFPILMFARALAQQGAFQSGKCHAPFHNVCFDTYLILILKYNENRFIVMYELLSFLARSKNRIRVLGSLDGFQTPTEISKKLKIQRSTVSRTIGELEEKELVKCLTPKERMGRLYSLTAQGKNIFEHLKKRG